MYNTYERVHRKGRSFMNEDFSADLLTLVDEDGQEHEFEILDVIENDDGVFYALLPTFEDPQEELDSEGYYIFEAIDEDGEQQLAEVEDEELINRLSAEFERRFDEMFEEGEDSEE